MGIYYTVIILEKQILKIVFGSRSTKNQYNHSYRPA